MSKALQFINYIQFKSLLDKLIDYLLSSTVVGGVLELAFEQSRGIIGVLEAGKEAPAGLLELRGVLEGRPVEGGWRQGEGSIEWSIRVFTRELVLKERY